NPWTGSGDGTTTVVNDGTAGPAIFSYNDNPGCHCGVSGSWSFSTTSDLNGTVQLPWESTVLHAWFTVTVRRTVFVTHSGNPTTTPLVNAGPTSCCTTPSNGFSYSGTTDIAVAVGDTYGFQMTGSNGDYNDFLQGTLTVGPHFSTTATGSVSLGATI